MKLKFVMLLLAFTCLYSIHINGQCNFQNIHAFIVPSCGGDSSGSIALTGLDESFSGQLSFMDCSAGTLITGTNITVNAGETKRIGTTAWANITINGGTLIICGSVSILNLNIQEGALINNGSLAIHSNVNIPEKGAIINNNGSVAFYNPLTISGTLFNLYGSMATYSTLTTNGQGEILNNSTFSNAALGTSLPDNFNENEAKSCRVTWTGTSQEGTIVRYLSPGKYTANISCGLCSISKTYTVGTIPRPQIAITSAANTSDTACNGTLIAEASGGVPPYYYIWADDSNSVVAFSDRYNAACAGKYNVSVIDSKGCGNQTFVDLVNNISSMHTPMAMSSMDLSSEQAYISPNQINYDEISAVIPSDTIALLLKMSGENTVWDISNINLKKYEPQEMPDPILNAMISSSNLLQEYSTSLGIENTYDFPDLQFSVGNIPMRRIGKYSIKKDAMGAIKIGPSELNQMKRVNVKEERKYFSSIDSDTVSVKIDSYYWYSSDTSTTPLFTFREKTKSFGLGGIHKVFYQEFFENSATASFNIDEFRMLVNLKVTPNPATTDNMNVSYFLPNDTHTTLSIDNSSTGLHTIINNTNQLQGNNTFNYDISSYLPGSYNITLYVGDIPVSKTLIINR